MTRSGDRLVRDYLKRLNDELAGLPPARRRELVDEIEGHIAEASAALPDESESEIRGLLDRIGEPAEIAAEARERFGVRPRRAGFLEVAALVMLLVGGVVVPIVGWLVGVVLLWASAVWTTRDKILGTLVVPGGLGLALFLAFVPAYTESCSEELDPETGVPIPGTRVCEGGAPAAVEILGPILFVLLLVAPLAMVAYLAVRMRRAEASSA